MEKCVECLQSVRKSPRALIALKLYTLASGILLFVAGLLGLLFVFKSAFYFVIGVYAMMFGFTVVGAPTGAKLARPRAHRARPCSRAVKLPLRAPRAVVEHGTWLENVALLKSFYELLDAEFHLLASQRGKGFFYSGAGVLTLFTDGKNFSLVGGSSICLIVAGVMHSFRIVHEEPINAKAHAQSGGLGGVQDTSVPPPAAAPFPAGTPAPVHLPPPPPPAAAGGGASEWSSIVASQNEREGSADWGAGTAREEAANERV